MYFSAIQKIGEQALQSSTSQILGEGLPLPLDSLHPHSWGWGGHSSCCPGSRPLHPPPWCLPWARACLAPILGSPRGSFHSLALIRSLPKDTGLAAQGPEPRRSLQGYCRAGTGAARVPEPYGKSLDFSPKI